MSKMSDKQVVGIIVAVASLIVIVIGGLTYFSYSTYSDLDAQILELEGRTSQLPRLTKEKKQLEAKILSAKSVVKLATKILPDSSNTDRGRFFKLMNRFMQVADIQVMRTSMPPAATFRNFTRYEYLLTIRGSMLKFIMFLSLLEKHEWFIKVDKFTISPGQYDTFPVQEDREKEITLTLSTFTYKEPKIEKKKTK